MPSEHASRIVNPCPRLTPSSTNCPAARPSKVSKIALLRDCECSFCAPLRELRRRLIADRKARGNEQALLNELITADPPEGGMQAYIDYLNGKRG